MATYSKRQAARRRLGTFEKLEGRDFLSADAGITHLAAPAVSGNVALVLLDPQGKGSLNVSGSGQVELGSGAAVVDSTSAGAVQLSGSAKVSAAETYLHGSPGISTSGNASLSGGVYSGVGSLADPFSGLSVQVPSRTFAAVHAGAGAHLILQPGTYLGGISLTGNASVTLLPGTYVLEGGGLSVSGSASLSGQGVLLYNTAPHGCAGAISITGSGKVTLTAPTSGPDQGMAIVQDPSSKAPITVSGSASLNVTGVIDAPHASLDISGNAKVHIQSNAAGGIGARVVIDDLSVSGNGLLEIDAATTPISPGQISS